jgi:hypothetical protein
MSEQTKYKAGDKVIYSDKVYTVKRLCHCRACKYHSCGYSMWLTGKLCVFPNLVKPFIKIGEQLVFDFMKDIDNE